MSYEIIIDGVTYDLSNYIVEGSDGIGMPPLHRMEERGPLQHGTTDSGYLLDARTFIIRLAAAGDTLTWLDSMRGALVRMMSPDHVIQLRRQDGYGNWRQIDCYYVDGLGMPTGPGGPWMRAGIMLRAPDPTWYDPEMASFAFNLGGGGTGWAVPWSIPWTIGGSVLDETRTVQNDGSWHTYPIITINGPIVDVKISNETTGKVLDFVGSSLGIGDSLTIDCRYGYKTVTDQSGANALPLMSASSDLATFAIKTGRNVIRVTGTGANEQTEVYLQYYTRYLSAWG